jgi:hypothetical protein
VGYVLGSVMMLGGLGVLIGYTIGGGRWWSIVEVVLAFLFGVLILLGARATSRGAVTASPNQ